MIFFTRASNEVQLKDPTWPEGNPPRPNQTVGLSVGGAIKVARMGEDETIIRLNFVRIPNAQYLDLLSFLQSTVTWSSYTFQYQDWNQVTYNNVRYMSGLPEWRRRRGGGVGGQWSGELQLRVDQGV